jgi:hypothetical protein
VLILMQDRCIVCANVPLGLEIILNTPDGTPRCHGSCGISHRSIWRWFSVGVRSREVCAKHTIGSKIILDTSTGTPR